MENNFEVRGKCKNTSGCLIAIHRSDVWAEWERTFIVRLSFRSTHRQAIPSFRSSPLITRSTTAFSSGKDRFRSATGKQVFGHHHLAALGRTKSSRDWDGWTHRKTLTSHHTPDGVQFVQNVVWRDENEEPLIDEIRTVNLHALADATILRYDK